MKRDNFPEGGCVKGTVGTWYQVFDKDGNCIKQTFSSAGAQETFFYDHEGRHLPGLDKRRKFEFPYVPRDPRQTCPQFTCPQCQSHLLEEVMTSASVTSTIVNVSEDGDGDVDTEYNGTSIGGDCEVSYYQCGYCGLELPVTSDADLFKYLSGLPCCDSAEEE